MEGRPLPFSDSAVQPTGRRFHPGFVRCPRRQLCPPLLVGLALSLAGAAAANGQTNRVLSGPATCQQCRIELEEVVAFGDSIGPGMLREQSSVATDSRGRFYATSNHDPTIAVFDGRGRFLRTIGRQGQGPGEFVRRPLMLFGPGDSLYAIVGDTRRMTVFSPEYEVARTVTLSTTLSSAVRLPDGRFLLSGLSRSAESIGHPLHLVDQQGAHVRSFGSTTVPDRYGGTVRMGRDALIDAARRLAAPVGPNLWTAKFNDYVLEQWSLDGRKLAQMIRQVPWFPPNANVRPPANATAGTHREPPQMRSLSEDTAGRLWTLTTVPDRDWQPRTLPAAPGGGTYTPDSLRHKLHDSVLEVIDPARGEVLATRTFDTLFMSFIAPDLLVSFTEDAGGNPRYVVWRVRLVSPASGDG